MLFARKSYVRWSVAHGHPCATLIASLNAIIPDPHLAVRFTGGLASRKPRLLLRLPGSFLLRLADRSLRGLLFQPPPRSTRPPV